MNKKIRVQLNTNNHLYSIAFRSKQQEHNFIPWLQQWRTVIVKTLYIWLMWGILNHTFMRRFRLKSFKCYGKPLWMVQAEQVDSVMFSSTNLWLDLWCPRPCRLVTAGVSQPEIQGTVHSALISPGEIMCATNASMSFLAMYHQATSAEACCRLLCQVKQFCNAILRWWFGSE